jgi:putative sterol carrier protein
MTEILTDAWAKEWGEALNASSSYRAVAASWEGAVLVAVRGDPGHGIEERAVFLDLWHGTCREARATRPGDLEAARYALTADAGTWAGLLAGTLDPMAAVMGGALDLTKGSVASLFPHLAAARELVAVARGLGSSLPPGWVAS